ncbi:MAG: cobalamin-dependent protein [Dehalococcoidia bacterium]|nr:MAG: cobalamin-dependent protein [Dehalococcoidia bacterium]
MSAEVIEKIARTIIDLENSGKINQLVHEALALGLSPMEIVEKGLRKGLDAVGKKYEAREYFLSELLYGGVLMSEALETLGPLFKLDEAKKKGIILLGTVRGDIHDIGKNIFSTLAKASGFEVLDLGVDVDPNTFIDKLHETGANILGLSALLTTTRQEMKVIIDLLNQSQIRHGIKVLIGGNAVTQEFAQEIGADAAALNAVEGIELCKWWVKK